MKNKNVDVENLKKHRLEYQHYQNEQKRKQREEDRKNTYPYCYGPYYTSLYMEGKVKESPYYEEGNEVVDLPQTATFRLGRKMLDGVEDAIKETKSTPKKKTKNQKPILIHWVSISDTCYAKKILKAIYFLLFLLCLLLFFVVSLPIELCFILGFCIYGIYYFKDYPSEKESPFSRHLVFLYDENDRKVGDSKVEKSGVFRVPNNLKPGKYFYEVQDVKEKKLIKKRFISKKIIREEMEFCL